MELEIEAIPPFFSYVIWKYSTSSANRLVWFVMLLLLISITIIIFRFEFSGFYFIKASSVDIYITIYFSIVWIASCWFEIFWINSDYINATIDTQVPARAEAAAAVARVLAGLPAHQRQNLSSSSEELSFIYGSKTQGQAVDELEKEFYEEVVYDFLVA